MNHHPLHTNAWFAEHETVHHKNVVVGNLVYSLVLGMSVPDVSGSAIANLEVESLVHRHPTFHGDTIYAETRVLEKIPSTSKDDRGIVVVETKGFNQDGLEVCYFRRKVMVWKREFGAEATASVQWRRLVVATTGVSASAASKRDRTRSPPALDRARRPLGRVGERGHAPTDPDLARHRTLDEVPRGVADAHRVRRRTAVRGPPTLGRTGLSPPGQGIARRRDNDSRRVRRRRAG